MSKSQAIAKCTMKCVKDEKENLQRVDMIDIFLRY